MVISPFGSVRFRDFFFTDVVTSIGHSLQDMLLIFVYFNEGHWHDKDPVHKDDYPLLVTVGVVVSFLPYWWRFWQCVHKVVVKNN